MGVRALRGADYPAGKKSGDLQQPQGAQPLEGQRRDALQGVVAEDPAGRKEGRGRLVAAWGCGAGAGIIKGRKETSGDDGTGHYLDYGDGSMV